MENKVKRITGKVILVLMLCFLMAGCSSASNENIQFVKEGTYGIYTNTTVGKAFDNFFENPKWTSFISESDEEIVEFTGKCLYDNVKVEVLMQFTLDKSTGRFSINYLSFNDVSQNKFMVEALIAAIFEN